MRNEYHPDRVSAPGETLAETLDALGMSQTGIAQHIGCSVETINDIIQGKAPITNEIALQLEQSLYIPASFWLHRQQHYQESLTSGG